MEPYGAEEDQEQRRSRVRSRFVLPSDRHNFDVQFDVLRRFVMMSRYGSEAIRSSRAEGGNVPAQAASLNVRFMKDIGLLNTEGRGEYVPTERAIRFVNALSVSNDKARPILREMIEETWFAEHARTLFATRNTVTEDEFIGELALMAETDKEKKERSLQVILEYLIYAGFIKRDDSELRWVGDRTRIGEEEGREMGLPGEGFEIGEEAGDWHVIQTEDFYVKLKSDPDVLEDVQAHLNLLKRKISRLQAKLPLNQSQDRSAGSPEEV